MNKSKFLLFCLSLLFIFGCSMSKYAKIQEELKIQEEQFWEQQRIQEQLLCGPPAAGGANQYILDGAKGTYTTTKCDSWAVDRACDDLPTLLVRGDTYYVADGIYARHIFNDAEVGESYITIRKATESEHGNDTGWNSSYGDGQAEFAVVAASGYETGLKFRKSYYIFDGVTGAGNDPSSYGFKISGVSELNKQYLIGLPMLGDSSYQVDHITISHTAIMTSGQGTGAYTQIGIYSLPRDASYASSDITLSYNYLSNASSNILMRQAQNWTIRDNYFDGNWSSADNHGQQISPATSSNIFLYNNIFKDSTTFVIGAHNESGGNSYWHVYNNIIIGGTLSAGFAMAESGEADGLVSSQFHNNTFVNVDFGGRGAVFVGKLTDAATQMSYAYNNLFYNCISPRMDNADGTPGAIIHDHNAYIASTGTINSADESAPLIDYNDPFVDREKNDYRLKTGTLSINTGKALRTEYSLDRKGIVRPQWKAWDIGAYEFESNESTLSVTSMNGTVASNPSGISCGTTCFADYDSGTPVTLTAVPNSGYIFSGWSGACSGTGTCTVIMTEAKFVTANFAIPLYNLTVVKSGTGTGTVTGSDGLINCGSTCSANYESGKSATLTASPASGAIFSGWSGACSGTGPCIVTMTAAKSVTATFLSVYNLTITKSVTSAGTVTSSDGTINCGSTCSANYYPQTSVTLTASANSGYAFTGWLGGGCSGTGTCTVSMTAATSVTANFATAVYNLTVAKSGTGTGTVTGSDGLINCGYTCSANYESGKSVTLTASAISGSAFTGWSGACSGTGSCTLAMTSAQSVTANFAIPVSSVTYYLSVSKNILTAGTVTSSDGTINCGSTCKAYYISGKSVTLTASPRSGYTFSRWTGACTGTGTCTVSINASKAVKAYFVK